MSTITKFDRPTAKAFGAEAEALLQALATKYGVKVERAGGTIGDLEFTMRIKATVMDPAASAKAAREEWDIYAAILGINHAAFGGVFRHKQTLFTITGCLPNRPKFCVKAVNPQGKTLLFPANVTHRATAPGGAVLPPAPAPVFASVPVVPPAPPLPPGAMDATAKGMWDAHCASIGFAADDFGKTFMFQGKPFTVAGITLGAKAPVIGKSARGTAYKFKLADVTLAAPALV
jgi:hypothetical protein